MTGKSAEPFSRAVRQEIYLRAGGVCEDCGVVLRDGGWHAHHRIPLSFGGSSVADNGVALCEPCHLAAHRAPHGESWSERHIRVTFHCPIGLADQLDRIVDQGAWSKSALICDALLRVVALYDDETREKRVVRNSKRVKYTKVKP